jgi:hypothetical protein
MGELQAESPRQSLSGTRSVPNFSLPLPPALSGGFADDRAPRSTSIGMMPLLSNSSLPPHLAQMDPVTSEGPLAHRGAKLEPREAGRFWGLGERTEGEVSSVVDPADVKLEPRRPVDPEFLKHRLEALRSEPPVRSDLAFEVKRKASGRGDAASMTPPASGPEGTPGDVPMLTVGSGGLEGLSDEAPRRKRPRLKWGEGLLSRTKAAKASGGEAPSQEEAAWTEELGSPPAPKPEASMLNEEERAKVGGTHVSAANALEVHTPAPADQEQTAVTRDSQRPVPSSMEVGASGPPVSRGSSLEVAARPGTVGGEVEGATDPKPGAAAEGEAVPAGTPSAVLSPSGAASEVEGLTLKVVGVDSEIAVVEGEIAQLEAAMSAAQIAAEEALKEHAEVEGQEIADAVLAELSDDESAELPVLESLAESSDDEPMQLQV